MNNYPGQLVIVGINSDLHRLPSGKLALKGIRITQHKAIHYMIPPPLYSYIHIHVMFNIMVYWSCGNLCFVNCNTICYSFTY